MFLEKFFNLHKLGTNVKQEIIAGATTFITMSYIIIVNPKILEAAGMPFGASMTATILSAFFGTILMGLYAKRPFAIAPYMGENAFIAYTVVKVLGYSWQTALGAIFLGGVLFTLITVLKIRSWLANAIPENLKIAFAVGIGLFLTFIGLNESGIVKLGVQGAPVHVGNLSDIQVVLAIVGFLLISFLLYRKIKGAILIGILSITILAAINGNVKLPENFLSMPPDISEVFLKLDIVGAISWGFFSVILTVFIMDFVDTMGTLLGVSLKAGLLDERGELPEIEKPMLCDALATIFAALFGTTTTGTYIESAAGIESGGRSGLTAVVTALFFLLALFLSPVFAVVPPFAYGPALIIVGMLMISPVKNLNMNDFTEFVPSFLIIILMSFTYNIGIGMTAGFVAYPLMKLFTGRFKEIHIGMWILFTLSLLFFLFYPY